MRTKKLNLSNTTNSRSPDDQLSRIFIGNLNTNLVCKKHILKLFCKFGQIKAISIHKGYCFVQFSVPEHAQAAIEKMHGQSVAGQTIDVNLVTDPKPHQKKVSSSLISPPLATSSRVESKESETKQENSQLSKKQNDLSELCAKNNKLTTNTGSMSDDSIHSSINSSTVQCCIGNYSNNKLFTIYPSVKSSTKTTICKRKSNQLPVRQYHSNIKSIMSSVYGQYTPQVSSNTYQPYKFTANPFTTTLNSDLMICGSCRSVFYNFELFVQHKRLSPCIFARDEITLTSDVQ